MCELELSRVTSRSQTTRTGENRNIMVAVCWVMLGTHHVHAQVDQVIR